jgi:hypothetical protein
LGERREGTHPPEEAFELEARRDDRGYDHDKYRRQLRQRRITPEIARRNTEHGSGLGHYRWTTRASNIDLRIFHLLLGSVRTCDKPVIATPGPERHYWPPPPRDTSVSSSAGSTTGGTRPVWLLLRDGGAHGSRRLDLNQATTVEFREAGFVGEDWRV